MNLIFSYLCREANAIFRLLTQCIIYLFYDMTKVSLRNNKSESPVNFLHLLTTLTAYFFLIYIPQNSISAISGLYETSLVFFQ